MGKIKKILGIKNLITQYNEISLAENIKNIINNLFDNPDDCCDQETSLLVRGINRIQQSLLYEILEQRIKSKVDELKERDVVEFVINHINKYQDIKLRHEHDVKKMLYSPEKSKYHFDSDEVEAITLINQDKKQVKALATEIYRAIHEGNLSIIERVKEFIIEIPYALIDFTMPILHNLADSLVDKLLGKAGLIEEEAEEIIEAPVAEEVVAASEEVIEAPVAEEVVAASEEVIEAPVVEEVVAASEEVIETPVAEEVAVTIEELIVAPIAEEVVASEEVIETPVAEEVAVTIEELIVAPIAEEVAAASEEVTEAPVAEAVAVTIEELIVAPIAEEVVASEEEVVAPAVEEVAAPVVEITFEEKTFVISDENFEKLKDYLRELMQEEIHAETIDEELAVIGTVDSEDLL